jgi:D-3-phosphoglycerate dehydrogenase
MENIDVYFAEQKGIKCLNAPEGSRDAVGEHTVALLLAALNKIVSSDAEVKKGIWNRNGNWGTEIKGKTIGIIGYGNMGSSFAQKISGFGAEVIAYDKYKFNYTDQFVTETDLQTVFDKADILSLHVPITEETHFMVNDAFLQNFKKNIFLLNTSRGEVVKTADLVKHLKTGKVLAAGLDVLEYEKHAFEKLEDLPEDFQYLSQAKNVVFTPHVAGWTDESYYKLARVLFEKIKEVLN